MWRAELAFKREHENEGDYAGQAPFLDSTAVLKNSSLGALAYTSAICSIGSRLRLNAAVIIRNCHPTFPRPRSLVSERAGLALGRLTLNILLSFAQFEREIIADRTRDKMAAARSAASRNQSSSTTLAKW